MALARVLFGIKLNLYLVDPSTLIQDQLVIPITAELKKRSWWKTLLDQQWKEDLDLRLINHENDVLNLKIKYHLWNGFYLIPQDKKIHAKLNNNPLESRRRHYLKTGMILTHGDRSFKVLITSTCYEKTLRSEFNNASSG
jgi:hypothetical protein